MKRVITGDGSPTLYNPEYKESYHHISGALQEARKKFVQPCKIGQLAKKGAVSVLDICFGLGYNSGVAIDTAREANPGCSISITALEKDKGVLKAIQNLEPQIKNYEIIKEVARNGYYYQDNIKVRLILGDAGRTVKQVRERFDAVFLDPFSPKKNPELWTEEFFSAVKRVMRPGAVMATYSCARKVRENLAGAGFTVVSGPRVGRRAPITIVLNS